MALKIAVVGGKGGITKTTLSRAISVNLIKHGITVKGFDLDDEQTGFYRWAERRKQLAGHSQIEVQRAYKTAELPAMLSNADTQATVIDGGAYFASTITALAGYVDALVMPTRYTVDDLESLVRIVRGLEQRGIDLKKIIVVFSSVADSPAEEAEARGYLEGMGLYVVPGSIPFLKSYGQCQDRGQAITENKYAGPFTTARRVVDNIIERAIDIA